MDTPVMLAPMAGVTNMAFRVLCREFGALHSEDDGGLFPTEMVTTRALIEDHRDKVEAMAKALLELETIDADQIDDIMAGKPPRPPKPSQSGAGSSSPGATPGPDAAPSANPA